MFFNWRDFASILSDVVCLLPSVMLSFVSLTRFGSWSELRLGLGLEVRVGG